MSVERAAVVAEARRWLRTPFAHQGRNRFGLDCVGLVVVVARGLGLSDYDFTGYGQPPDGALLRSECDRVLRRIAVGERRPGDVLLLRYGRSPQHMAIVSDRGIVHAYFHGGVVETTLPSTWGRRIVAAYALPGVA